MVKLGTIRKIHLAKTYTYEELSTVTGVCEATVRSWRKSGLRVLTGAIPHIIVGADARVAAARRNKLKKETI